MRLATSPPFETLHKPQEMTLRLLAIALAYRAQAGAGSAPAEKVQAHCRHASTLMRRSMLAHLLTPHPER